jgi:hypothetical protein
MFCKQCGKQVSEVDRFCPNCGATTQLGLSPTPAPVPYASRQTYQQNFSTPPNYLVQAILTTIFCCMPFGIVAIVYAAQVGSKAAAGDGAGALDSSNKARTWCWAAFLCGIIPIATWFIFVVIMGIAGSHR